MSPNSKSKPFERRYVSPREQESDRKSKRSEYQSTYQSNYGETRDSAQNSSRPAQHQVSMLKQNEPTREQKFVALKPSSIEISPSQASDIDIEYYDESTTANYSPSKRSQDRDRGKAKVIERLYVSVKY